MDLNLRRVALVTGAARGQGRSHCVRFGERGDAVIAVDICADLPLVPYEQSTPADLDETIGLVKAAGGAALPITADVRDFDAIQHAVELGLETFGHIEWPTTPRPRLLSLD